MSARKEFQKSMPLDTGRQGKLDYKSEYLVFNIYVHCGWTETHIVLLFDVSPMMVHNIIYAWANVMNDVLSA